MRWFLLGTVLAVSGLVCGTFHRSGRSGEPLTREGSKMDCTSVDLPWEQSTLWEKGTRCDFSRHWEGPFAKNRPTCLWMSDIPLTGDNARKSSCSLRYSSHRLAETWNSSLELKAKFSSTVYPKAHASLSLPQLQNKGASDTCSRHEPYRLIQRTEIMAAGEFCLSLTLT